MQNLTLPETFRPLLWSYDFDRVDPLRHKKTIVVQTLNYGTLDQWRWLIRSYGREGVREVLTQVAASEIGAGSAVAGSCTGALVLTPAGPLVSRRAGMHSAGMPGTSRLWVAVEIVAVS